MPDMTDIETPEPVPLLRMAGIVKRFPGVVALSGVHLKAYAGEVLALMGENGAGKSTLMKILGGAYQPDEGEIQIDGKTVVFDSVRTAKKLGIALIHQELMLAPNLDITANIFLGSEPKPVGLFSPVSRGQLNAIAAELMARVGLTMRPTTPVASLTVGEMQMVEIAKALSVNARVIIMDEPTSSLTAGESARLFKIIEQLKSQGIAVIYISHRMEEVFKLADRITVLRDGKYVGDVTRAQASHEKIVAMMVGRELSANYFPPKASVPLDNPVLIVRDLLVPGTPAPVSFTAYRGEILGFAGLVGAGRTELMQTIFGVTPALAGNMILEGEPYAPRKTQHAIARGVSLAPEDRKRNGLVLPMSIAQNISLPDVRNYAALGFLNRAKERSVATTEVSRFRVKAPSVNTLAVNLSGGNQQKVVLGKWLAMNPRVLILDEPTRGIDVGAKAEIYRHMSNLASQGITILMVSSEMEEVIGMSNRVVVMHERRVKGILGASELTQERIAQLMTGNSKVKKEATA
jgi:ribose transport system ATP-binding protein